MSNETEQRGQTQLERMLLHIVQAMTIAGIVGGYVAMTDLKTSNAILQTEMRALSTRIDDFRSMANDRYTASQALRDFKPVLETISDHETRIRKLERGG